MYYKPSFSALLTWISFTPCILEDTLELSHGVLHNMESFFPVQDPAWTYADLLSVGPSGTNFNEFEWKCQNGH